MNSFSRPSGRAADELRAVRIERSHTRYAEGSVLIGCGETRVLCTASIDEKVPLFLRGKGEGWITAALLLWIASVVLGAVGGRSARHTRYLAEQLAAEGDHPSDELRRALASPLAQALNYASFLALVAALAVMVWKPGA